MHQPAAVLLTIPAMAAFPNYVTNTAEKRTAKQGMEQKFLVGTQKESLEMDKMIAQQQLHKELDGSSVGSLGSFSVVDLTSEDGEELTRELNHARTDQIQIEETNLRVEDGLRKCFCGMSAKVYVSRMMGANSGRRFQRCPKTIEMQCGYFRWIEPAKEMEEPGVTKDHAAKNSRESSKPFPLVSDQALVEIGVPKDRWRRFQQCNHLWDRTGTNGSKERRTCNRCGLRCRRNQKINKTFWELTSPKEEKADREKNVAPGSRFKMLAVKRKEARAHKEALVKSLEAALKR